MRLRRHLLLYGVLLAGCGRDAPRCDGCDTVRIAAVHEPSTVLPPLVLETVGRDISDRVFERLAVYQAGRATIDPAAFRPGLAQSWEQVDSLSWLFHLRPDARWHDGRPVTALDVAFSFAAYTDSTIETSAASALQGVTAEVRDSHTVAIHFPGRRWNSSTTPPGMCASSRSTSGRQHRRRHG